MNALAPLIDRLLTLDAGSPEAEEQQHAIEHLLMAALASGGRDAGEALVQSLAERGYELRRMDALPCMWRVLTRRPRVLEIWFTGGEDPVVAASSYRVGAPWGTRTQKRAAQRQAAFYTRYEKLAAEGMLDSPGLDPEDRLILAIGEFEADVNNGGFGQYLENKGVQRAGETLVHLGKIGARRSARRLCCALEAGKDSAALDDLDRQFHDRPEDLASLVMRDLEKQEET